MTMMLLTNLSGVPPLEWDETLATDAGKQADYCEENNMLAHGNMNGAGQNAFMAMPARKGSKAAEDWYSGPFLLVFPPLRWLEP